MLRGSGLSSLVTSSPVLSGASFLPRGGVLSCLFMYFFVLSAEYVQRSLSCSRGVGGGVI